MHTRQAIAIIDVSSVRLSAIQTASARVRVPLVVSFFRFIILIPTYGTYTRLYH